MKIKREFAKLKTFARTKEGWGKIESAFSDTDRLLGFAIDPTSWKYKIGRPGESHIQAKVDLLHRLVNEMTYQEYEKAEKYITEARLARLHGYQRYLILLMCNSLPYLEWIEPRLIDMKIGLPVGILFYTRKIDMIPRLSNRSW